MTRTKSTFLALLAVLLTPIAANAVPILDQEHFVLDPNASGALSNGTTFGRAQTFTVGIAGIFDSLDVELTMAATQARLIATSGGAPIGGVGGSTVLATSSLFSNVGDVYTFDFGAAGLAVNVGDVLAIELFGNGWWRGAFAVGGGSYAGGSDYFFNTDFGINNWSINQDFDWNFRTYVNIPEPGTLALLGIGLLEIGLSRFAKS